MTNLSLTPGSCFAPFLDASAFSGGGYVAGRNCNARGEFLGSDLVCCLPCPATDWLYSDGFHKADTASQWLNVAGIVLLGVMLWSQMILPPQKRSNYLSICLTGSALGVAIGYALPLATKPGQCYDAITPNDMYTSTTCALTGAITTMGELSVLTWILVRAISMHLQVCWGIIPGARFFWGSQLLAWGFALVVANLTLFTSGVSFRFGQVCYLNHHNSDVFWGPLIAVGGAAVLCQLLTFGHCARVYLSTTCGDGHCFPVFSIRSDSIAHVYQRLMAVLCLQWRSMCLVTIVLMEISLFCVLFIYIDHSQEAINHEPQLIAPWVKCLILSEGDKNKCLYLVHGWYVKESISNASLIVYSFLGIVIFVLLIQPLVFRSWWTLFFGSSSSEDRLSAVERASTQSRPRSETATIYSDFDYRSPIASPDRTVDPMRRSGSLRTKLSFLSDTSQLALPICSPPSTIRALHSCRESMNYGPIQTISSQSSHSSLFDALPALPPKEIFKATQAVEIIARAL